VALQLSSMESMPYSQAREVWDTGEEGKAREEGEVEEKSGEGREMGALGRGVVTSLRQDCLVSRGSYPESQASSRPLGAEASRATTGGLPRPEASPEASPSPSPFSFDKIAASSRLASHAASSSCAALRFNSFCFEVSLEVSAKGASRDGARPGQGASTGGARPGAGAWTGGARPGPGASTGEARSGASQLRSNFSLEASRVAVRLLLSL